MTSDDSCKTWSRPEPAPGRLRERTFIRNHIVTRDGRNRHRAVYYGAKLPPLP